MMTNVIALDRFRRGSDFYEPFELLITVKSFDLQAIRKRYIASRASGSSKTGSVERREPVLGGIASVKIGAGRLESSVVGRMKEPRGIHFHAASGQLGIAAENTVYLFDAAGGCRTLSNPWFSYIHTLEFDSAGQHVLISSSGFDLIQEYSLASDLQQTFEWLAWENGFATGTNPASGAPMQLTRDAEVATAVRKNGGEVLLVSDPANEPIPTAARAAFINSVSYGQSETIDSKKAGTVDSDSSEISETVSCPNLLATFFHAGAVYSIDRASGLAVKVVEGLKNPHGGRQAFGGFLATSTGTGEVILQMGELQERFDFSGLPGKPAELASLEWLQNSILVGDSLILTIDSNRNAFVVFDPAAGCYDLIPYDPDWAIQDGVVCRPDTKQLAAIGSIATV